MTTTKLGRANTASPSLRATIPLWIVEQFNLEVGDSLSWRLEQLDGKLVIIAEPVK